MYRIYAFLKKHYYKLFALWASFASAVVLENINNSWDEVLNRFMDFGNVANAVFWVFSIITLLGFILYKVSGNIVTGKAPGRAFLELMNDKTFEWLQSGQTEQTDFSWGYNKNLHRCKNPIGWDPTDFWISEYNMDLFAFPNKESNGLTGYTEEAYARFCDTDTMRKCRENHDDMDRFAVSEIIPNFNNKEKRVQIKVRRTKWSALQFHWDYMRVLDVNNRTVHKGESVRNAYRMAFLGEKDNKFLINSFCLHLILEDIKGNAVLSRISSSKANDYSTTWAATIGEQLALEDFYNENMNEMYPDFVVRWTKRALEEEFELSENDLTETGNELQDYVNMDSLRVLSIDLEGDIYNIALTAVIKIKMSADEFAKQKGIQIDSEEITNLKACNLEKIREILLNYPDNIQDYHPSTYLRLLMFYLYKKGIRTTYNEISRSRRKRNGQ